MRTQMPTIIGNKKSISEGFKNEVESDPAGALQIQVQLSAAGVVCVELVCVLAKSTSTWSSHTVVTLTH